VQASPELPIDLAIVDRQANKQAAVEASVFAGGRKTCNVSGFLTSLTRIFFAASDTFNLSDLKTFSICPISRRFQFV
jgi:hypothetical protein